MNNETPRFNKAYAECLDDTGKITRLEPLYDFAERIELENKMLRVKLADCAAYLAFHGPVGSTPDSAKLLLQDVQRVLSPNEKS